MSDTTERARQVETVRAALKSLRGSLPEPQNKAASQRYDDMIVAKRREYKAALKALEALAAELAAAEKRNAELERLIEELGDTQLAGTRNLPADIRTGAGGACGRHGVFDGLVCPKCAASEGKP